MLADSPSSTVWWLEEALADGDGFSQALAGDLNVDVCIVGGGYTGLWTALEIAQHSPDTSVAVIEQHVCGMGASGRNGRADKLERLDPETLRARVGSPVPIAGARQTDAATVQPALLVRGLRRVAIRLGVQVYEGTPMLGLDRGAPATVLTPAGRVRADRVVVATGAWASRLRELRRSIVPIGTTIVATEPLGDRIGELPWADGEGLGDARLMVHYSQVTPAGRLIFGRGGGAIGAAGRVTPKHFHDAKSIRAVAADLRRWFPSLHDAALTHAWGGPVDRTPGHFPFTAVIGDHGSVICGLGYSGKGVGPSALLGRILGRQVLGIVDEDTTSALTRGPIGLLPPDPLRSLGGVLVRAAVERSEDREERGRRASVAMPLLRRLVRSKVPPRLDPRFGRQHGGSV